MPQPPRPTRIAAVLTPRGRGAVATIRVYGDDGLLAELSQSLFRAANGRSLGEQPIGRICYGHWGGETHEEIVACRLDAVTTELHCHGGDAAVQRIVKDLQTHGCTVRRWPELLADTAGVFEAECTEALAYATTLRTATILLQQTSGVLRAAFTELGNVQNRVPRDQLLQRISDLLRWSAFGLHLTRPWSVVLAGLPNVGKSSLINALVGYARSLVYDQPGTTRDVVTAETALDGWPIRFSDTAGIRDPADPLETAGIERARQQLLLADCRILLIDQSQPPCPAVWRLLDEWPGSVLVANKCDLPDRWGPQLSPSAVRVSALTGDGIETLIQVIARRLVPQLPDPTAPVPITERQVALLTAALHALQSGNEPACFDSLRGILGTGTK